jgi:heme exporter protein A
MRSAHFLGLPETLALPLGHRAEMLRLSASGLGCIRGFRSVFTDINFELSSGDALALTGPNGSGKSSLLRLLAGLLRPSGGRIALQGGAAERTLAEQAHYLGHLDAFKHALTVAENLDFWTRYLGDAAAPTGSALASVGLGALAHLPAGYLSAGQRRRLSLARLIAAPRPVWLLDEPTSALDSAGQDMLAGLMRRHLAGGGVILAATHGPLGIECKELQLGKSAPSPPAGEGWGGGSRDSHRGLTPTPNLSPQGGGAPAGASGNQ